MLMLTRYQMGSQQIDSNGSSSSSSDSISINSDDLTLASAPMTTASSNKMKSFLIRDILSAAEPQTTAANLSIAALNSSNNNNTDLTDEQPSRSTSAASSSTDIEIDVASDAAEQHQNTKHQVKQLEQSTTQQRLHQRDQQHDQQRPQFQMNSPLDALFQMTSSTFDALKRSEKRKDRDSEHNGSSTNFSGKQTTKKKRKSRTAFTNNQIYELERRFRMQKYLSPTDRDEIALSLNLSNAQVITWFQNRRAKLKRDLEEQKRDIETAQLLNIHKIFLESFQALSQINPAIKPTDISSTTATEVGHVKGELHDSGEGVGEEEIDLED